MSDTNNESVDHIPKPKLKTFPELYKMAVETGAELKDPNQQQAMYYLAGSIAMVIHRHPQFGPDYSGLIDQWLWLAENFIEGVDKAPHGLLGGGFYGSYANLLINSLREEQDRLDRLESLR